jgi:hypothetical protein
MLRLLSDADFDGRILDGLARRLPDLDVLRVQDAFPPRTLDTTVLHRAAAEGRVLVTHDVNTMVGFAYERLDAGLPMPGLFAVPQSLPVGQAVEELLLVIECSREGEWETQVVFLPL